MNKEDEVNALQGLWRQVDGNVSEYASKVWGRLKGMAPSNAETIFRLALAVAQLPPGRPSEGTIWAESIVAASDQEPYVCIRFGKERLQMPPEDARQHAHQILQAAEAAESDAFLLRFMAEEVGVKEELVLGRLLEGFRRFRQRKVQ